MTETELRHLLDWKRDATSLLKRCRKILDLSGIEAAAQAGMMARHGIPNAEHLAFFKNDLDRVIGEDNER
jgi:hypothetical protein